VRCHEIAAKPWSGAQSRDEPAAGKPAPPGPRFDSAKKPPSLVAILFHVLQEYARHAGHLDIARELVDGQAGE
jgi:hypothetical protein